MLTLKRIYNRPEPLIYFLYKENSNGENLYFILCFFDPHNMFTKNGILKVMF